MAVVIVVGLSISPVAQCGPGGLHGALTFRSPFGWPVAGQSVAEQIAFDSSADRAPTLEQS